MAELKVHGVGVATADPELKYIGVNKIPVCNVNLAFNRSFKKADSNEWEKETAYMRAQIFGRRAESMADLVKKGSPVFVDGYMVQNNWENAEGEKRMAFVVTVREFYLCKKFTKNDNEDTPKQEKVLVNTGTSTDDEIPF